MAETNVQNDLDRNAATFAAQKYTNGESVFQWWTPWFKDKSFTEPPATTAGKNRPHWYSGSILGYCGFGDLLYAGIQHTDVHQYYTY